MEQGKLVRVYLEKKDSKRKENIMVNGKNGHTFR